MIVETEEQEKKRRWRKIRGMRVPDERGSKGLEDVYSCAEGFRLYYQSGRDRELARGSGGWKGVHEGAEGYGMPGLSPGEATVKVASDGDDAREDEAGEEDGE
jgi:hypothetical protein